MFCFSALTQAMLTNKYVINLPEDSRTLEDGRCFNTNKVIKIVGKLILLMKLLKEEIKFSAKMAISLILRDQRVTSVLIDFSKTEQILDHIKATKNTCFMSKKVKRN